MIEVTNAVKIYHRGKTQVTALQLEKLSVPKGQFLSVMGVSGSGKSTLLHLLGALDTATSGQIEIEGRNLSKLPDDELSKFRRERLGFIFQFFNLLPTLSALENVMMPSLLSGASIRDVEPEAKQLLDQMGLQGRLHHRPDELSGGQMQRVAIARALLTKPALLLADEPTGNLDSKTSDEILQLLCDTTRQRQLTVVMVTHDPKAASFGDRIIHLADGKLSADQIKK